MKTATTTTKAQVSTPPVARARFLEIRAGRLRTEEARDDYSNRLAPGRRFNAPTD